MTAALTLANDGLPVKIVERESALGGMLRDVHTLYPDRRNAAEMVAQKANAVSDHPNIEVLLDSQVTAIAEFVQRELKSKGIYPLGIEGLREGHWVLMDYADVIIHIFYEPIRTFYDLEGLWADAKRIEPIAAT